VPTPDLFELTPDNVDDYGIHCVADPRHPGRQAKIDWFKQEYHNGLRIRMLVSGAPRKSIGFIEYVPGEHTWRAVVAPGYLVVHCIWVKIAGKGYGSMLVREVVEEARKGKKDGVAVVSSTGTWCAKAAIFERNGFKPIDERAPFSLLVRKLRKLAADPGFAACSAPSKKNSLVFRHSAQCPYVAKALSELTAEAESRGVRLELVEITTSSEARLAPTPYGVTALSLGTRVLADHAISRTRFRNILRQEGLI
jgi:ribosomal protein S18 acetylase RimI-like enzyme